jgi:hypothetical protein
MKNSMLRVIISVLVVLAGAGAYVATRPDDEKVDTATTTSSDNVDVGATKEACEIFTEAVAKDVLGANAQKTETPVPTSAATADIGVTQCLYDNGSDDIQKLATASVLVRAAKNTSVYTTNEYGFNDTKTSATSGQAAVDITGIGDKAWFNPSIGQVNVLVEGGKYWLIVSVGDGVKGTRELGEKLARAVVANL